MMKFEETRDGRIRESNLSEAAHRPNRENLSEVLSNNSCTNMLNQPIELRDHVRRGGLGKTAKMWMQYLDFVWMLLRFQRGTKENNFSSHLRSLEDMSSLFFTYDHPNNAHYTVVYILTMLNLDKTQHGTGKLLKGNGISVNRSSIPFSRNAVDITVEQTINKHAKSQGGNIGCSTNHSAYYRWCTTRHSRASSLQGTGAGRDGHYRKLFTQRCQTRTTKYHKVWKQQEKLLKPSQISSIHSMCMTTTICIASHLVPPQPRTLRKICYQSVKWGKRPSSHSSNSC